MWNHLLASSCACNCCFFLKPILTYGVTVFVSWSSRLCKTARRAASYSLKSPNFNSILCISRLRMMKSHFLATFISICTENRSKNVLSTSPTENKRAIHRSEEKYRRVNNNGTVFCARLTFDYVNLLTTLNSTLRSANFTSLDFAHVCQTHVELSKRP